MQQRHVDRRLTADDCSTKVGFIVFVNVVLFGSGLVEKYEGMVH